MADGKLLAIAEETRAAVHSATEWVVARPTYETEQERFHWAWDCLLLGLTWDISDAAISLGASQSVRAARALNRSLFEYAARAHHYARHPEKALIDGGFIVNSVRKVMKPVAKLDDPKLLDVRKLIESGTSNVSYPNVNEATKSILRNAGYTSSMVRTYTRWLEAEYALASGFVHGSQVAFLDVLRHKDEGIGSELHWRSRSLQGRDEIARSITCMVTLLWALQIHYNPNGFGCAKLIDKMNNIGPFSLETNMARHNALFPLLGIK